MRTLVGIAALIVATGVAGCSCSAYQRISTRPCPSGSGSYELEALDHGVLGVES